MASKAGNHFKCLTDLQMMRGSRYKHEHNSTSKLSIKLSSGNVVRLTLVAAIMLQRTR